MGGLPERIRHSGLVLVEGVTDEYFLKAWLREHGLEGVHIWRYEGKSNLATTLQMLPKVRGYPCLRRILVVRDADRDADAAWRSVTGAFAGTAPPFPVPKRPGSWSEHASPAPTAEATSDTLQTAVVVVGDNDDRGELEDWLLQRAAPGLLVACGETAVACAEHDRQQRLPKRGKAQLYAALAVSGAAGTDLGHAHDKGLFAFRPGEVLFELIREMVEAT